MAGSVLVKCHRAGARRAGASAAAAIGLAIACFIGDPAQAQSQGYRLPRDCYLSFARSRFPDLDGLRPDRAGDRAQLEQIAETCARVRPQDGLVYAYFYAAQAERILGEGPRLAPNAPLSIADPGRLAEAARLFEIVAGMAGAEGADPQLRRASRLELARVYRLQGRQDSDRYADATRLLNEIVAAQPGELDRATLYERAMVIVDRDRPGIDDDTLLLSALQDLQVFGNRDQSATPNQYVAYRGPIELAKLATRLGYQVLEQPPSLENTQQALRLFTDAVRAHEALSASGGVLEGAESSQIYVNMGLLNLRMATLLGSGRDSFCAPGAEARALDAAERNFADALRFNPQSADANWGKGCALMARGNYAGAAASLQTAVGLIGQGGALTLRRADYYLMYARALAALGRWDGPGGALANFDAALAHEADAARAAGIRVEIARIYTQNGRTSDAIETLSRALSAHGDAVAYLMRGELLLEQNNMNAARDDLVRAAASAGNHQPRANFLLSQLEERAGNGQRAVDYATAAYLGDRGNAEYRRQACLTRIVFGRTGQQGQSYCAAESDTGPGYSEALFYEGLFWLREAYYARGGNQRNDWAQAMLAFERGMANLGSAGQGQEVEGNALPDLLAYGRRFALHCAGLGAANSAAPGDASSEGPRRLFGQRYNLQRCWR